MDILAHGLWAGAALGLAQRYVQVPRRAVAATIVLAVLPDLAHLAPPLLSALWGDGSVAVLRDYVLAEPGQEPPMPYGVESLTHHLHCIGHSAVVAGVVTVLVWALRRAFWVPLLGWWSHIVIDVFSHSTDFYPSPVLYPFTRWGFDGLAWNTPWFTAVNYTALAIAWGWLVQKRWRDPGARP